MLPWLNTIKLYFSLISQPTAGLPGWGVGLPPAHDSGTQAPSACGSTLFTVWLGVPSVQLADGETKTRTHMHLLTAWVLK